MKSKRDTDVIEAAGGLLWRDGDHGKLLAVVHRPKYDDWTLPKGKLEKGESWESAALREIREETGCRAKLGKFAGCASYMSGKRPKIVLYWHMELVKEGKFEPTDEIDKLVWMTPEEAATKVFYSGEKELLRKISRDLEAADKVSSASVRA